MNHEIHTNASFQNESASKQFESKSKQPSTAQIDQDVQDLLNQCDQAISQIIEGNSIEKDPSINIVDISDLQTKKDGLKVGESFKPDDGCGVNILDSLRNEFEGEEAQQNKASDMNP